MSLPLELQIRSLLTQSIFYSSNIEINESYEQKSVECLNSAGSLISKNLQNSFENFSLETLVLYAEVCLTVKDQHEKAKNFIEYFFQRNTSDGQMYVRALLIKSKLISLLGIHSSVKAEKRIQNIQEALTFVQKAIAIVSKPENKIKYSFLIYNISLTVYEIIRPMFTQYWQKHFTEIVEKVEKLLEEVSERDGQWRCKFSLILFQSLYTQDKKPDAFKLLDKIWAFAKDKGLLDFQEYLMRIRIHYGKENGALLTSAKKDAETVSPDKAWKELLILQMIKSSLIQETQIEKELINLINSISSAVLPGQETHSTSKLNPVFQERLAEAGRIALRFNLVTIADSITVFLSRVRQLTPKAFIHHEYNRAELLIKKNGPLIDSKTGVWLNSVQIKAQEIERRKEALNILDKTTITNKKVNDPEIIYEGATLIWNISLPFLNAEFRDHIKKPFTNACSILEFIQSNDHSIRVNFHLELAKLEMQDDYLMNAESHVKKALMLDPSIPIGLVKEKFDEKEDIGLYQRPYERFLMSLKERIDLKGSVYIDGSSALESIINDMENAYHSSSDNLRIDILQKCFSKIIQLEFEDFYVDPSENLVQEEIVKKRVDYERRKLFQFKQKIQISAEISKYAFECELHDLAMKSAEYVVKDEWDIKNASEMILIQVECYFILAQTHSELLLKEGYELAFADPTPLFDDEKDENNIELTDEQKDDILAKKKLIVNYYSKALKFAGTIKQNWMIFNGAIYIWNIFLPVFRNPTNDGKVLIDIHHLLRDYFEEMKITLKELEKKQITDYDIDTKMQIFANIGIIYARLLEGKSQYDEVMKVCEALLLSPLNHHTRKLVNSIKARVSGVAKTTTSSKAPDKKTQEKPSVTGESIIFEVVSQLEIIQNTSSKDQANELIKKCFDMLSTWEAKENDQAELELHAELWARLARLSLNEQSTQMAKYALRCVEFSLSLLNPEADLSLIAPTRVRWYSLAEFLYAESLVKLVNSETQEADSQKKLYFSAIKHGVEAANKGSKAGIITLVIDACKLVWNIATRLQHSPANRKELIKPLFACLYFLKQAKERDEPDLVILISQLLFRATLENEEYLQFGEKAADMVFELIPKSLSKPIWEAKMVFMSKQGKNELQAISNMKEADPSLQAKIWVKLARTSTNTYKQFTAYNKALEILKKEFSVEIVDVLIEFSEWLIRHNYERELVEDNLFLAADTLIEIEIDEEEDEDDEGDGQEMTLFSRSSRGKKSSMSKLSLGKSKNTTKKSKRELGSSKNENSIISKDSKNSKVSRMSRATLRDNKTMKSSKRKSLFMKKEENPIPITLNVSHLEKLFRIHWMLSTIALNQDSKIQYAIDAKFFIERMFEISICTFNKMEENALMYANIKDKSSGVFTKQTLPTKTCDWLKFFYVKEFIEKSKSIEDLNLMSKFVFETPELDYYAAKFLIEVFEESGLDIHAAPLLAFQKFISREIISFATLSTLTDLKISKCFLSLGFVEEGKALLSGINMSKMKISENEKKLQKSRADDYKTHSENKMMSDIVEQGYKKPKQFVECKIHRIWLDISRELIKFTEFTTAKAYLDEANGLSRVLKDIESLAEIELLRAVVAYYEGDYKACIGLHMQSHRLIKSAKTWESSIIETTRALKKVGKYPEIKSSIKRMQNLIENEFFLN